MSHVTMAIFAALVGEPRTTVRSIIGRGDHPLSVPLPPASKTEPRLYSADDIRRWAVFREIRRAGHDVRDARDRVRAVPDIWVSEMRFRIGAVLLIVDIDSIWGEVLIRGQHRGLRIDLNGVYPEGR